MNGEQVKSRARDNLGKIPKISDNPDFTGLDDFYSSYPIYQYGVDGDGTEYTDSEINSMMPDPIFPIYESDTKDNGEGEVIKVSEMDTTKSASYDL